MKVKKGLKEDRREKIMHGKKKETKKAHKKEKK